jgi:hypothetical protein
VDPNPKKLSSDPQYCKEQREKERSKKREEVRSNRE